ncbi:MAG: hypothetical protein KGJ86_10730, partial [Chloroflexota bacterium]|nr:hypothetical protein [Chloroflexota bacterium]
MEAQELSSGYGKDRLGDAPRSALTRRAFIRVAAGGAVVGAAGLSLLLDACGGAAPSSAPGSTAAGGAPATQAGKAAAFPTYIPFTGGPKPDYHSSDPRITDGFENYPKSPFKAWTKDPPGTGKNVSVFIAAHYPPPTPFANNPTWHEVNKRLNANVQMNIVAPADYRVKLATLMAGNDLPDIIHLFFGIQAAPALPDFIKAQCADLTPYLSGDAIKEYPFLASIPTYAWKNSL